VAAQDDRVAAGEEGALPAAADISLQGAVGAALVAETRWAVEA
jgi:hypothetical protein